VQSSDSQIIYGKTSLDGTPYDEGVISSEYHSVRFKRASEFPESAKLLQKTITFSQEQYNSALNFAQQESQNPADYLLGVEDCIAFTQGSYKAP
jgi:hypothetical protein